MGVKVQASFKTITPRYKARFVIKGLSQIRGFDYTETYEPLAKTNSYWMIMAITTDKDIEMI